jgi:hypothetical protein
MTSYLVWLLVGPNQIQIKFNGMWSGMLGKVNYPCYQGNNLHLVAHGINEYNVICRF